MVKQIITIVFWCFFLGIITWSGGWCVFTIASYMLSNSGYHSSHWIGWNLLFYGLVVGPTVITVVITFYSGLKGKLPGTLSR